MYYSVRSVKLLLPAASFDAEYFNKERATVWNRQASAPQ